MGDAYRTAMRGWFEYTASDYDLGLHRASVQLDLQDIALPNASVDVVLTPHVLEHVPDTEAALRELFRITSPGGTVLLQVPILQGATGVPSEPEFHDDNTPVFWRFGPDVAGSLRAVGFKTETLCTEGWAQAVADRSNRWPNASGEFDVDSMLQGSTTESLTSIATVALAERLGLWEPYQFVLFEARKPG